MTRTAPLRHALTRPMFAALALLALAVPLLIGSATPAAAAVGSRTWTLSSVTFSDGGTMTGSFVFSDDGVMSDHHLVTTGGDTGTYGTSMTYDGSNSGAYPQGGDHYVVMTFDGSRVVNLHLGGMASAQDGDTVPLASDSNYECFNCAPWRTITAGSIVAGTRTAPPEVTGTPTVSSDGTGPPQVGHILTGDDSTVAATPSGATKSHQWLRDGVPIPDATDTTYQLVNDDAGHTVAFQVGATLPGYDAAAPVTSAPLGPVEGGQITLPTPTVTGTAVVDGTLTATLPDGLEPSDAAVVWQWYRYPDLIPVGDGSRTYRPVAADAGALLVVAVKASKNYFSDSVVPAPGGLVAKATFTSAPAATISGIAKVGETLTAAAGPVAPAPDELQYQWFADGEEVAGATRETFEVTAAQRHTAMTVKVTALRDGYVTAADTSEPTGDVATELAPGISFDVSDATIRRGEETTLSWSTVDTDLLEATGGWTGLKPATGTAVVSPTQAGDTSYELVATNGNGTTTAQVTVSVARPATTLGVSVARGPQRGHRLEVSVSGLDDGESYTVEVDGTRVASGTTSTGQPFTERVTLPAGLGDGVHPITVTGDESDRTGTTSTRVVGTGTLSLDVAAAKVRPRQQQVLRVSGLSAGERVVLNYRGKQISPKSAKGDARGVYRQVLRVGQVKGGKYVKAVGAFHDRPVRSTFTLAGR